MTIPSPDVVCSSDDDVAALLAAEDGARHLHPLEDVLVADGRPDDVAAGRLDDGLQTAVRQDRHDEAAAGQLAALEPVEGEDPEDLVAVDDAARPRRPRSAGRRRRRGRTRRRRRPRRRLGERPRARSPRSRTLMFMPSGSAWMTSSVAPVAAEDLRPDRRARAVRAVEDDAQAARVDRRGEAEPVREVVVEAGRWRRPSTGRARVRRPGSSSVRQISCSSSSSIASSSLRPSASSTLSPLSSAGLCDAETMIPAANGPVRRGTRAPGSGTTPTGGHRRRGSSRRP